MYFYELLEANRDSIAYELRKEKALRKHSLHGKIAASVLLELFISGKERCNTTDYHYRMSGTKFLNVNNIQSILHGDTNITTQ